MALVLRASLFMVFIPVVKYCDGLCYMHDKVMLPVAGNYEASYEPDGK